MRPTLLHVTAVRSGEEFVALISSTADPELGNIGEKLRKAIEVSDFHHNGQRVPITISLGYSTFRENDSGEMYFRVPTRP